MYVTDCLPSLLALIVLHVSHFCIYLFFFVFFYIPLIYELRIKICN